MWESTTMSFGETFVASVLGLLVVMAVLVILAFAIIIMTKIMKVIGLGNEKKATSTVTVQNVNENQNLDEENYAVVLAAVHEEISRMPGEFRVVKIAEIN